MPTSTDEDFASRTASYRPDLLAHCYRMLGSVHEADDLVQETMLRAWRAWDRYDAKRASVRTWLHRIATNACLTALEGRARRPLPSGLGPPNDDPSTPLVPDMEVPWLQPFPDARLADPASHVVDRSSLRLALVATMQLLPPRQRAVLVLRESLGFSAAEVADALGTSRAAVDSALHRARATLSAAGVSSEEEVDEPPDAEVREVVERYARAFERADVNGLVALLTDDAVLEMPPVPLWYRGRADYGRFMERVFAMRGDDWRMRLTSANGQPALAAYCAEDGDRRLHTLQVLTVGRGGVGRNVVFADPRVFAAFDLPTLLDG